MEVRFAHFEKDLLTFQIIIFRAAKECEVQGNFVSVLFIRKRLYRTQFNVLIFPRTVLYLFARLSTVTVLFKSLLVCYCSHISDPMLLLYYPYDHCLVFSRVL